MCVDAFYWPTMPLEAVQGVLDNRNSEFIYVYIMFSYCSYLNSICICPFLPLCSAPYFAAVRSPGTLRFQQRQQRCGCVFHVRALHG